MKPHTTAVSSSSNEWTYAFASISPSREDDAARLGPNLRQADKDEIYAVAGIEPELGLQFSMEASDRCYTVRDLETDEPLSMFGTSPTGGDDVTMAAVWFLGCDDMFKKNRMSFLRNSKFWVEKLFGDYNVLHNLVDKRNAIHIRWLKWLGFTFIADVPNFGYEKRVFRQFYKRREDV
jgi:hypothetical protein